MGRKRKEESVPIVMPFYPEVDVKKLAVEVEALAIDCGLKKPLRIDGPTKEPNPQYGHGYVTNITEIGGKERMATARYTFDGKNGYWHWQMDGMITG